MRKSKLVWAMVLIIAIFGVGCIRSSTTSALCPGSCQYPSAGRDFYHGYFTNQTLPVNSPDTTTHGAFWSSGEAPWSVTDADQFINFMQPSLFDTSSGSVNNHTGAASYIVTAMLGYEGPDFGGSVSNGVTVARSRWNDWQQLVKDYDAAGLVNWNDFITECTGDVQANLDYIAHDSYYYQNPAPGCSTDPAITFFNPTTHLAQFTIKKTCGNPIGDNKGLPALTVPITATCSAAPNGTLEVGRPLGAVTVEIHGTSGSPPPTATGQVTVTAPSGTVFYTGTINYGAPTVVGGGYTQTGSNTSAASLSEMGTYTITATYPPAATFDGNCGTFTGVKKPYFEVLGGDVVAGSGYGDSCAVPTGVNDGRIDAFNRDGAGSFRGSATDRAIIALKNIKGIASGTFAETGAVTSFGTKPRPTGLDFANTGTPGNFGNLGCAPDYAADALAGTITHTETVPFSSNPGGSGYYVNLPGVADPDGTYVYEFDNHAAHPDYKFTIFAGTVPAGKHFTLVFKGALGIVGNIDYAPYASLVTAPSLTVISTGDEIGIHQAVTSLSGFYVVENGTITTCNQGDLSEEIINPNPGFCDEQLTIYGVLAAKDIRFDRTSGSPDGSPAEKLIFSPELWAAGLSGACIGTCTTEYDSITSLPPVL